MLIAARRVLQERDLALELGRRLGPVGLVLRVLAGAERLPRGVEGDREVGRLLGFDEVDEHREEAVDAVRVLAVLRREVVDRKGEERPVCQRMAVHDEKGRLCGVRHPASLAAGIRQPLQTAPKIVHGRTPRRTRRLELGATTGETMGRARREDGHRVPRVLGRALRRDACRSRATRRPVGLMHGGAYVVLGESLGSMASRNLHAGPGPAGGRGRHQRHAHAVGDTGRRDRRLHADRTSGARITVHEIVVTRRSGPPALDDPHHEHRIKDLPQA